MKQYIDKNRVEEILRNLWKKDDGYNAEHRICYNKALQEVQCELDTLEVKEVEEPSNDLEEEIELVKGDYEQVDVAWNNDFDFIARHFYELGLKAKGE